jgi:hypothetical protein
MQQAIDGGHGDRHGGEEDQGALDAGREVLGLRMPIGMLLVGRLCRQPQCGQGDDRGDEVTTDSAASESSPTEPVSSQASVLSEMVATAAAMDSHSSRYSRLSVGTRDKGVIGNECM